MARRLRSQASIKWTGDDNVLLSMRNHGDAVSSRTFRILLDHETRMENWAKKNAPWTDRTGDARRGLHATADLTPDNKRMFLLLSHSVSYGLWLEILHEGRFAIIWPTIERFLPNIRRRMDKVFESGGRGGRIDIGSLD